MPYQTPQPPLSRREQLVAAITELERQRHEANMALTNPNWDYEASKRFVDTIKGIDILLGHARRELAELK